MPLSLRTALPHYSGLAELPICASAFCPRPPTLWQRWWARHEGIWLQERWYCSSGCFQQGVFQRLEQAAFAPPGEPARPNRVPLGLILLSQGAISHLQLKHALDRQRAAGGGKVGEWLVRAGAVSEQQVMAALAAQQGCPAFPEGEPQSVPDRLHWPEQLVRRYLAVPVFHNSATSTLFVGFQERVDRRFLLALELVLRCRTQSCMVTAATSRRYLERRVFLQLGETIEIHQRQSGSEMTRTISNYAEQVRAERCTITGCGGHLWTRLESARGGEVDFLFRLPMPG